MYDGNEILNKIVVFYGQFMEKERKRERQSRKQTETDGGRDG